MDNRDDIKKHKQDLRNIQAGGALLATLTIGLYSTQYRRYFDVFKKKHREVNIKEDQWSKDITKFYNFINDHSNVASVEKQKSELYETIINKINRLEQAKDLFKNDISSKVFSYKSRFSEVNWDQLLNDLNYNIDNYVKFDMTILKDPYISRDQLSDISRQLTYKKQNLLNIKNKISTDGFFNKIANQLNAGTDSSIINSEIKGLFNDSFQKTTVKDNLLVHFQFNFNKNKFDYQTHLKPIGTNNLKKINSFKSIIDPLLSKSGLPLYQAKYIAETEKAMLKNTSYVFKNKSRLIDNWSKRTYDRVRSITEKDFNHEIGRLYNEIKKYRNLPNGINRISDVKVNIKEISNSTLLNFELTTVSDKDIFDINSGKKLGNGKISFTLTITKGGVAQRHPYGIGAIHSPTQFFRNQISQVIGNLEVAVKNSLSEDALKRLSSRHHFEELLTPGYAGVTATGNYLTDLNTASLRQTQLLKAKSNISDYEEHLKDAFKTIKDTHLYRKNNKGTKLHYLDLEFDAEKSIISQVSLISYDGSNRKTVTSIYNTDYQPNTDKYAQYLESRGKLKKTSSATEKRISEFLDKKKINKFMGSKDIMEFINQNISSNDIIYGKSPFMNKGDYFVLEKLFEQFNVKDNVIRQIKDNKRYKDVDIFLRAIDNLNLDDNFNNLSRAGETYKYRINNLYKSVSKYNKSLAYKMKARAVALEKEFLDTSTIFSKKDVGLLHNALYDTMLMNIHENMINTLVEYSDYSLEVFKNIFKEDPNLIKLLSLYSSVSSNAAFQGKVNSAFGGLIVPFYPLKGSVLDKAHQMLAVSDLVPGYKGTSDYIDSKLAKKIRERYNFNLPFATEAYNILFDNTKKTAFTRLDVGYILGVTPFSTDGSAFYSNSKERLISNVGMLGPEKFDIIVDSSDLKVGDTVYNSKIQARKARKDYGMMNGAPLYNLSDNHVRITSVTEINGKKVIGYRTIYGVDQGVKANIGASESIIFRESISMKTFDIITEGSFIKRGNYQQLIQVILGRVNLLTEGNTVLIDEAIKFINKDKILSKFMKASSKSSANILSSETKGYLSIEFKNVIDKMQFDKIGTDIITSLGKLYSKLGINNDSIEKRVVENLFKLDSGKAVTYTFGQIEKRNQIIARDFINNIAMTGYNADTMKAFGTFFRSSMIKTKGMKRADKQKVEGLIASVFEPYSLKTRKEQYQALKNIQHNFAELLNISNAPALFDLAQVAPGQFATMIGTSTQGGLIFDEVVMQTNSMKAKISPLSLEMLQMQDGSKKMLEYYIEQMNLHSAANFHKNLRSEIMKGNSPTKGINLNKVFQEKPEMVEQLKRLIDNSTLQEEFIATIGEEGELTFPKMTTRRIKAKSDSRILSELALITHKAGGAYYTDKEGKAFQFFSDDFLLRSISRKGDRSRGIIGEMPIILHNLLLGKSSEGLLRSFKEERLTKESAAAELPATSGRVNYGVEIEDRLGSPNTVYNPKESIYVNEVLINRKTFTKHKDNIFSMIEKMDMEDLRSHIRYLQDYGRTIGSANSRPHQMWTEIIKGPDGKFSAELKSFAATSKDIFNREVSYNEFVDKLLSNSKEFTEIQYKQAYLKALESGIAPLATMGQKMPVSQSTIISPLVAFFRNFGEERADSPVKVNMKISRYSTLRMKADTDGDVLSQLLNTGKGFFDWLKGSFNQTILASENPEANDVFIGYLHSGEGFDVDTGLYYDRIDKSVYKAKVGSTGRKDDYLSILKKLTNTKHTADSLFITTMRNASIKGLAGEAWKYSISAVSQLKEVFANNESLRYVNDALLAGYVTEIQLGQRRGYTDVGKAINYLTNLDKSGFEDDFRKLLKSGNEDLQKFRYLFENINNAPEEVKRKYASHIRKSFNDIDFSKVDKLQLLTSYSESIKGFGRVYSPPGTFEFAKTEKASLENLYKMAKYIDVDFINPVLYKTKDGKVVDDQIFNKQIARMTEKGGLLKYGILGGTALMLLSTMGSQEQSNNTGILSKATDERDYKEYMESGFNFGDNRVRMMRYNYNQRISDEYLVNSVFNEHSSRSVRGQQKEQNALIF